jgi:hypothetical protein
MGCSPAGRKAECRAIHPTTNFHDEPADCDRPFAVDMDFRLVVPEGWEAQVAVPAWSVIVTALPLAVTPPLVALVPGASLFWVLAGFRRSDDTK